MRNELTAALLAGGFVLFAAATVAGQGSQPAVAPDAREAVIDGRVAVGAWPTEDGEIVGPEGFSVHLLRDGEIETELAYPAGHWFQPPPGRYKVWLEGRLRGGAGEPRITPSFTLLNYGGGPFRGRGLASTNEVGPAGWVKLHPDRELADGESLRLLHLDPTTPEGKLTRGFLRALPAERQGKPLLMPAGGVVGLVYDLNKERYRAVSRPEKVPAGGTLEILPTAQRGVSHLMVILRRTEMTEVAAEDDLELHLKETSGRKRAPDVLVPGAEWVYALWYEVDGRVADVSAQSSKGFLQPTEVVLEPGGLAVFRGRLAPRPYVDARLELPPGLRPKTATLQLVSADNKKVIAERELPLDPTAVTRFEGLPAARMWARLILESKPLWKLSERLDLRDGVGREVTFRPRPIMLSGTIYHGDEPTPGEVTIQVWNTRRIDLEGASFKAEVEDDGTYRAVLYDGGRFIIDVALPGVPGPPMPIRHVPYIRGDTEFDIHVPRSAARVRVLDAETGEPVEDARVLGYNEFLIDWMEPVERGTAGIHTYTDEEGWAEMPPLYPGDFGVAVTRDGYLQRIEKMPAGIRSGEVSEYIVEIEPAGQTTPLRLRLSDGRPALGAEIRSQAFVSNAPPLWEGTADAEGRVQIPSKAEGQWLLVRHPEAASWIDRWQPPTGEESVTWTLLPRAEPVTFRTVGLDGNPVGWTELAVRFPTTWVSGQALAWLTRSQVAASHRNALWTAQYLPAQDLQVYAGDKTTLGLAINGLLSGTALRLDHPWPPDPVEVPVSARR